MKKILDTRFSIGNQKKLKQEFSVNLVFDRGLSEVSDGTLKD
jgi:hypothetical protein